MKRIRVYSLRTKFSDILKRIFIWFGILFSGYVLIFSNSSNFLTDVVNEAKSWKISQQTLYAEVNKVPDTQTVIWPVKQVVDLSYKSLQKYWISYEQFKKTSWDKIPVGLKRDFPLYIGDYINKYKNITLKTCWDYFSNPEELNYFTFLRRVVRTIWTASYDWEKIWIRWSWTHAGVDIISSIWTPIYSISTWLVVEIKYSNKWFGNFVVVLYQVDGKYYEVFYAHLYKVLVKPGQIVGKWQKIALMWNSWNSTTPHLHFQINKLLSPLDTINWKASIWWYHNLSWVREYTVSPIEFVESHLDKNFYKNGDNFPKIKKQTSKKSQTHKIESDDLDLVAAISKQLEKKTKEIKTKAYIKNVSLSLIDNKVQVGHWFVIKLAVATGAGQIAIKPSNTNLQYQPDLISNPDKTTYTINVLARKEWVTTLTFTDGKSVRTYQIQIYNPATADIFGLQTNVTGFNLLEKTFVEVYPIDKFGRKLDKKLEWTFKVYFETGGKQTLPLTISSNWKLSFAITGKILWKSKLIVKWKNFVLRKNVVTDISKDYPYNGKYADDLAYLIKKWIVKWYKWKIMPNDKLSRRALLIIVWRSVLKVNYNQAKQEMLDYMKKHGRFFKDIDGTSYADPYIFIAWKKWIIKWENGYSLANTYVSKGELLTILERLFDIPAVADPLNVWTDLQGGDLKAVADTAKRYNLYLFKQFKAFNAGKLVTRLVAFETLYRFLTFENKPLQEHLVAPVTTKDQAKAQLQQAMQDIFDF